MPDDSENTWPPELIHNVLIYLNSGDIATMARVSFSFRAEAVRLLSRRRADWEKSLRKPDLYECAPSPNFVNNDASYLHSLRFACYYRGDIQEPLITDELCDGLLLMPSLKRLMIHLPYRCPVSALETMNSALARCTFSLKTLYISEHLDLLPWILNQTEVETIAVHSSSSWGSDSDKHLSCHRLLSNSPYHRNAPTFFIFAEALEEASVAAFPTFSDGWSAKPIKQYLESFLSPGVEILSFCLYLRTLDELENSHSAIGSISYHFTDVDTLELQVGDCMIHLNPGVLASGLSYLAGQPRELHIKFWELPLKDEQMAYSYKDHKSELSKAWSERCPSLVYIGFPDGDNRRRAAGWKSWEDANQMEK